MSKFLEIKFDTSGFDKVIERIKKNLDRFNMKALTEMGDELLRLSVAEVPHDTGALQASGNVDNTSEPEVVIVGFHTPYAARLHEHPEYKFQKGRKGKYLEDPLKHNLNKWLQVYAKGLEGLI